MIYGDISQNKFSSKNNLKSILILIKIKLFLNFFYDYHFFSLPCHLPLSPSPGKTAAPGKAILGGMIVKDGETEAKFNKSLFVFHQVDETNLNFSADILHQALQYTIYI